MMRLMAFPLYLKQEDHCCLQQNINSFRQDILYSSFQRINVPLFDEPKMNPLLSLDLDVEAPKLNDSFAATLFPLGIAGPDTSSADFLFDFTLPNTTPDCFELVSSALFFPLSILISLLVGTDFPSFDDEVVEALKEKPDVVLFTESVDNPDVVAPNLKPVIDSFLIPKSN